MKYRIYSIVLFVLAGFLAFFIYSSETGGYFSKFKFKLGLDLAGGTELIYKADVSAIEDDPSDAMSTLRDVIERRINIFGVSEPLVQVEEAGLVSGNREHRLIVELPGVTDVKEAIAQIGKTPLLEFRLQKENAEEIIKQNPNAGEDEIFSQTGLTGQYLSRASVQFTQSRQGAFGEPYVSLEFNSEGKEKFAEITRNNVGKVLAVFLDGSPISTPVIREEITGGQAQISGGFSVDEAKELVRNLNYGALPVPISLESTQTVGATLGGEAFNMGINAGLWGLLLVIVFLLFWYRLPGFVAVLGLFMYIVISLSLFKLIPVTLTAAGLAGFILSVGMAVDANILIFERMKEEMRKGKEIKDSAKEGFARAWTSIRDSNISSIITAIVLFWLGTSSVKGFALTLGIGVLVSMFSAITASRTFLFAMGLKESKIGRFLFSAGIINSHKND